MDLRGDSVKGLRPIVSDKQWAAQNDLPIERDRCPKCGCVRVADIPYASSGFRGFVSELHPCGEDYRLIVLRPIGDEIKRWAF